MGVLRGPGEFSTIREREREREVNLEGKEPDGASVEATLNFQDSFHLE
jgi:hypothetical protein